jgi:hypothetical protein
MASKENEDGACPFSIFVVSKDMDIRKCEVGLKPRTPDTKVQIPRAVLYMNRIRVWYLWPSPRLPELYYRHSLSLHHDHENSHVPYLIAIALVP